jgi:hypothetical protein
MWTDVRQSASREGSRLLYTTEIAARLREMIRESRSPIQLCSAFVRSDALLELLRSRDPELGGRCLVRWQPGDLISGASDLEVFDAARQAGLKLHMRTDFHGKVFSVPPHGLIVGSANLTSAGLGLLATPNVEVATHLPNTPMSERFVSSLFCGSTEVTPSLKDGLKSALAELIISPRAWGMWPGQVLQELERPGQRLMSDECFHSAPEWIFEKRQSLSPRDAHDAQLLGLNVLDRLEPQILSDVAARFRSTAAFRWLVRALSALGGTAFFGALTSELHNALADDPTPSRQGVKQLLGNLVAWVAALALPEICVDRPRVSTRLSLNGRL